MTMTGMIGVASPLSGGGRRANERHLVLVDLELHAAGHDDAIVLHSC